MRLTGGDGAGVGERTAGRADGTGREARAPHTARLSSRKFGIGTGAARGGRPGGTGGLDQDSIDENPKEDIS